MRIHGKYVNLVGVVIILLCVFPTIISAFYSVPYFDDFYNANLLASSSSFNVFTWVKSAFDLTVRYYNNWQGTYSYFIGALFSPLNGFGRPQLVIICVLFSILTPLLVFNAFWRLGKHLRIPNSHLMILLTLFAFYIYNVTSFQELFYWYTGIVIYTLPICCFSGALLLLEKYLLREKKTDIIICVILLFIAMGGSLEVSGFACILMLLLFVIFYKKMSRKQRMISLVIFSLAVIFALFNALAPGNYVRYGSLSSNNLSVIKMVNSILVSLYQTCLQVIRTLVLKHYSLFGLVAFALGLRNTEKANISFIQSLLFVLLPIITIYPIALGQGFGFSASTIQNRYEFLFDLSIILALLVIGYSMGNSMIFKKKPKSSLTGFMMLTSLLIWIVYPTDIELMASRITVDNLMTGKLQSYSDEIYELYHRINDSTDNPIVIESLPDKVYGFMFIELSDNPEYWTNYAVSYYYKSGKIIGPGIIE